MPAVSVRCPHCSARNEIVASEIPEMTEIRCSHCYGPLGSWTRLERVTVVDAPTNPRFPPIDPVHW